MSTSISKTSLKNTINQANPGILPDYLRVLKLGDMLRAQNTHLFDKNPAPAPQQLATLEAVVLPDDAKAISILAAYAKAAGIASGPLTVVGYGVTPTTGQIAVGPNGDIVTLAADAITDLDVSYVPAKQDIVELVLPVAAGILAIPATFKGLNLLGANVTKVSAGVVTGEMVVLKPGAAPVTSGRANLSLDKTQVLFVVADNATEALVKLGVVPAVDADALLTNDAKFG